MKIENIPKPELSICLTNHNMHGASSTIMTYICSNCNKNVETKTLIYSTQTDSNGKSEEIRIWDVIAYVYRIGSISLDEFKIQLKKVNHHDHNMEEESIGMCDVCLSLLSDSYKVLKQFESLTHQASFIQHVQNTFKIKREKCTEVDTLNPSTYPDQTIILSLSEKVNSDLFDSFNYYEDDHQLDETDNYFSEEFKVETANDLFENESPSVSPCNFTSEIDQISRKPVAEISLKPSKQLVVKIEKLSEEDLKFYHEKRKKDCINNVRRKGRKPKLQNVQCSSTIKKKYSPKKQKKESQSTSEDKKKYDCKICGKTFVNFGNFHRFHMPTHFQDMSCKLCDKVFKSIQKMNLHMKVVHKQESEKFYRTCEVCGKTILSRKFWDHMKRHGPRETFKCDKCGKEYFNKRPYEDHLLTHSDNYTPLLCRHCGSTFKDRQTLYIHEMKHTEEKKVSCEICSMKFFYKHDLKNHMAVHTKERSFVCDECGGSYKSKDHLYQHQKIHKDIAKNGEWSSKCQYCEKVFKHSEGLRFHMKIHEKKYKCSFCGKILSSLGILKKHENLHKMNPGYQPRKYYKTFKLYQPEPSSETQ